MAVATDTGNLTYFSNGEATIGSLNNKDMGSMTYFSNGEPLLLISPVTSNFGKFFLLFS